LTVALVRGLRRSSTSARNRVGTFSASLAAFGPRGGQGYVMKRDAVLGAGEVIRFDVGCMLDGYNTDIARNFSIGEPDERCIRYFDATIAGVDAAVVTSDTQRPHSNLVTVLPVAEGSLGAGQDTVRAVRAFQLASALPVTGKLDVATWQLLLAREPVAVTWRSGSKSGRPVLPASAKMRPLMREIPPKPH